MVQAIMGAETAEIGGEAKRDLDRLRAKWCYRVLTGEITVIDYIRAAIDDERLRKQSLIQLVSSDPAISYRTARSIVKATYRTLYPSEPVNLRRINVGWLISDRAKGRRWEAFLDAYTDPTSSSARSGAPMQFGEVSRDGD